MSESTSGSKRSLEDEDRDSGAESPQSVLPSEGKRRRTATLPKGQILKVKMHNFMTYSDATIYPGSQLNLVLGPNGTGKSSFVNALCLGLAGDPKLLGRAENVRDFVRKGTAKGYTEITLSNGEGRRHVITRHMNAKENATKWLLNGRDVTKREILQLVASLKIQVDNLCQFLPQDKVVMFARLTPIELLMETEKAIGSGELYDLHQELSEKKKAQNDTSQSTAVLEAELSRNKAANAGLERDVARFQEREAILDRVKILDRKLPWMRYKEAKDAFQEIRTNRDTARRRLQAKRDELAAQQGPLRDRQRELTQVTAAKKKAHTAILRAEDDVQRNFDKVTELSEKLDEKKQDLENLEEDARVFEERLAGAAAKVEDLEQQIANLPPPPQTDMEKLNDLRRELVDLNSHSRTAAREVETSNEDIDTTQRELGRLKQRLQQMDSVRGQRLQALEPRNKGITEAANWIANNKNYFRGRVYGPVITEVEVADQMHAAMLEQHVPMSQWLVFVTETKEDQDQLIRLSRENNWKFKPSVSCFSDDTRRPIPHPKGDASEYRQYGVTHTLDEVFEAPDLVKHNLKDEAAIHETYVGGSDAVNHVEALLSGSGVRVVWTPDSQYRVNTSAYNPNARSQTVIPLRPPRFLKGGGTGSAERAQLVEQIAVREQELAQLLAQKAEKQRALDAANTRMQEAKDEQKRLTDAKSRFEKKRRDLQNRLTADKRGLNRMQTLPHPRDQAPQLQADLDAAAEQAARTAEAVMKALRVMWDRMKAEAPIALAEKQLELIVKALQQHTKGHEDKIKHFEGLATRLEEMCEGSEANLRERKDAAIEKTGPMTGELGQEFRSVAEHGDTFEAISAAIARLEADADAIVCANPRVMEEYRARAAKIQELEARLQEETERLETRVAELQQLEARWLPQLQEIVAKINRNFALSFAKIGCAGEVCFHHDEDYDRCAINIRVKFRGAEELQVLNAQRQSGGERSVSTILYLVALQEVAACPFRVVDEINQGMDPYNERKVFVELVRAATGEGTPQCFLLTPKLLPDLPYTGSVTVIQLMNGPRVADIAVNFNQAYLLGNRQPLIAAH